MNNLLNRLGVTTFIAGNYIVMDDLVFVKYEYNPRQEKVVQSTRIPQGWQMADEMVLRAIQSTGRKNFNLPGLCFVCPDSWPVPDKRDKFNSSKNLGYWQIHCWHGNSLGCRFTRFGETVKQKGSSYPVFETSLSYSLATFLYRPMFPETEIQQEINRISR